MKDPMSGIAIFLLELNTHMVRDKRLGAEETCLLIERRRFPKTVLSHLQYKGQHL